MSQKRNHVKFIKLTEFGTLTAIVPEHKEIAIGTLRSILRQTKISLEEFENV
ncbi:type II toxin-antitoxin system HicA family toxin [Leptospira borgpetersenii]|nr:type II toxin-antitoxin system HicA family toxin [Leptospira borgpetersenii]URD69891.1 type II toxin-antitoxin system HicA family toxin [Leptospira borgpetersenii]UVD73064.1 type II toxin-antitoxin system HicA family toxin [Leptospira borgpetersenii]UVD76257.1 type II toxin-antitoxin system HicA family toxin [Leptospira borgpetersenii]UZW32816.1 type II toxin-antitoxin system HicA family toxin [Leptospira borgpetersenii]